MLDRSKDERVEYFDQLRAYAIIPVLLTHSYYDLLPGGSLGVSIFFALSGFLITSILLQLEKLTVLTVAQFATRRFFRIYPAYFCSMMLTWFLSERYDPEIFQRFSVSLPGLLTFTQLPQTFHIYSTDVLWTLNIEFWFYITLPILLLIFGRKIAPAIICLSFIGLSIALNVSYTYFNVPVFSHSFFRFLSWADTLAIGALIAIVYRMGRWSVSKKTAVILRWSCLIALIVMCFQPSGDTWTWEWFLQSSVASILGAGLIASYVWSPKARVLNFLVYIGRISYSIYLLHAVILDFGGFIRKPSPITPSHPILFFLVVIVAASLSYFFIEKPGIWVGRHLSSALRQSRFPGFVLAARERPPSN